MCRRKRCTCIPHQAQTCNYQTSNILAMTSFIATITFNAVFVFIVQRCFIQVATITFNAVFVCIVQRCFCTDQLFFLYCTLYIVSLFFIVHCIIVPTALYHIVLRPCLALQNLKSVHVFKFTGLRQGGSHESRGFKLEGDATASGLFRAQTPRLPGPVASRLAGPPGSRLCHGRPGSPSLRPSHSG
jgi:hypothetical protein